MQFEVRKSPLPSGHYSWVLTTQHGPVCQGITPKHTESEIRGEIADVKRTMGSARYAKVVIV